jgi:serine/threonine protein kinase
MDSPEQWTRVAKLLAVATNTPAAQREAWIDGLEDSPEIKIELRRMLGAWTDAGQQGFLDEPVLSRPLSDDRLGTMAGEFTLIRRLGSGGVGEVYLGFDEDPARLQERPAQVAIKILHRRFLNSHDVLAAFARERALLESLHHAAVVPVLDSGTTSDGLPYLVMEYIGGQPIDTFCNRRPAGLQQRLNLFRQLCDATAYLHERDILHLDLKPSNVLVTPDGEVKLLDMGLARLIYEIPADNSHFFVSAGFSSPEQVCGKKLSVTADIYSLGAVLYVLLTGRHPLELENLTPEEIRRAVVSRRSLRASTVFRSPQPADRSFQVPVSLTEWESMLQGPLDRLLEKMLRPSPWWRPRSAGKLSVQILKLQRKGFTRPLRQRRSGLHHLISIALLAVGVLLLGGAVRETWEGYRTLRQIRDLAAVQNRVRENFRRLKASSPTDRQCFVADQTATLEQTYKRDIPELLSSRVAPRRQVAGYALDSMALVSEMAPTAMERNDLAESSMRLLQTIAAVERNELHNDREARWALASADLLCQSSIHACTR